MAARSVGNGHISFGLVSIPVKLYPATQTSSAISFHLLDKESGTRVRQQYIRPSDGKVVPREDMVKGYEFAKDQYVIFTPEELKALEEKADQAIDITEFVPLAAVDPVYFDKPYYLGPERGGEKAYRLLSEVMKETGRSAVARYAARGKQYLVLLRPVEKGLVMQQLLYSDEVRPMSDVPIPDVEVREAELKLARQLVEQIASETFDPTQYHDEVRERVLADVQRKVEGQQIETSEPAPAPAQVIDLMEALKASLGSATKGGRRSEAATPAPAAARRPARRSEAEDAGAEHAVEEKKPAPRAARGSRKR